MCASPKYEYRPIQVDYAADREREKRGRLLMEKLSQCRFNVIRSLIKTSMSPNEIVDKAEDQCSTEREAWIDNEVSVGVTRQMARNALDGATCARSVWTRYISLVRGGASAAEIRTFTNTFRCD